jgi:hypothetical protein
MRLLTLAVLTLALVAPIFAAETTPAPKPKLPAPAATTPAPAPATTPAPAPATAPAPVTAAPTVDEATVRRADQAADAYLAEKAAAQVKPDPESEKAMAEIEVLLLEAKAFLDAKEPLKAGDQFVTASKKMIAIPVEQRRALAKRFRQASTQIIELSRRLLDDKALDTEPAPAPADAAPATPAPAPVR